jgi:hypothetical protein
MSIVPLFVNPLATDKNPWLLASVPTWIVELAVVVSNPFNVVVSPVTSTNPSLCTSGLIVVFPENRTVAPDAFTSAATVFSVEALTSSVPAVFVSPGPSNVDAFRSVSPDNSVVPNAILDANVAAVLSSTNVPSPIVPPLKLNGPFLTVAVDDASIVNAPDDNTKPAPAPVNVMSISPPAEASHVPVFVKAFAPDSNSWSPLAIVSVPLLVCVAPAPSMLNTVLSVIVPRLSRSAMILRRVALVPVPDDVIVAPTAFTNVPLPPATVTLA